MFAVLGDFKIDVESEHRSGLKALKRKEGMMGVSRGKKSQKHTAGGIPQSSPT